MDRRIIRYARLRYMAFLAVLVSGFSAVATYIQQCTAVAPEREDWELQLIFSALTIVALGQVNFFDAKIADLSRRLRKN